MQSIGQVPTVTPDPDMPRGVPVLDNSQQIASMQDVADISGSEYSPAAQMEPVFDPNTGEPVIDPTTGERKMRVITPEDYNDQLAVERAGYARIQEPVRQLSEDPYGNAQTGVRALMDEQNWVNSDQLSPVSARLQERQAEAYSSLDSYIEQVGTDFGNAVLNAQEALFSRGTRAAISDGEGGVVAAGYKVMADNGIADKQTAQVLSTMAGLSLAQAVGQIGVAKKEAKTPDADALADTQDYMPNVINSTRHFLENGLRRRGLNLKPGSTDLMAKAMVIDRINRGELIPTTDPTTGRVILEGTAAMNSQARNLQRISEAVVGESSRRRSSSAPTHSGAALTAGGPKMTANAIGGKSFTAKAANLTKNILGSIALVFRPKDVDRKRKELALVLSKEYVYAPEGKFHYSTHPLAKRNGIDQGAYLAAKHKVKVHKEYDKNNPTHVAAFKKIQDEEALKIMEQKKAEIEYSMKSIGQSPGLRYSEWIHSNSNQRFYPNNFDTDYMGSKGVIRDIMGLAYQDTVKVDYLFDPRGVAILQRKADFIFNQKSGQAIHKELEKLTPNELGAIGAMHNAVMYYYTAIDTNSIGNVVKLPVADAIRLYSPAIAETLADLGMKYNAAIEGDLGAQSDETMMGLWAATEKGEALGTLNLWDDFFKAKALFDNPKTSKHSMALTHHAFDDGNQNGIFLQALFFGMKDGAASSDSLLRLSMANPNQADMRVFGMGTMVHQLQELLQDKPDEADAWRAFWAAAKAQHNDKLEGVAKDFFKKPLMQNSYGKDAAMFSDVLVELMEADQLYSELAQQYLAPVYGSIPAAAEVLSDAVEVALRQLIDSSSVNMMKNIGRYSAVLNRPIVIEGVTGDHLVISPVGVAPVNRSSGGTTSQVITEETTAAGEKILLKKPQWQTDTVTDPETGAEIEVPTTARQLTPAGSKGTQYFLNRQTMKYDAFHNPLGTGLGRQFAVLTIQALDGDLVKWTAIEANKGRKTPRPVMFVHDSIISTPGQSLIYTNMYNNIAIPGASKKIGQMGKKIKAFVTQIKNEEIEQVARRGELVGIGSDGDYPAMGALFDDFYKKLNDNGEYRQHFIDREKVRQKARGGKPVADPQKRFSQAVSDRKVKSPEEKWSEFAGRIEGILKDAKAAGWVPDVDLSPKAHKQLAVPSQGFPKLVDLAGQLLNMYGPQAKFEAWADAFEKRVETADKTLMAGTKTGGIRQMSSSGGKRMKSYKPEPIKDSTQEAVKTIPPEMAQVPLEKMFDVNAPMPF
jgi:actin-related protein